jgi:hypothetical protein
VMFLNFIRMCRNMFLWLFFLGLVIAGVNLFGTRQDRKQFPKTDNPLQYLSISYLRNVSYFFAFGFIFFQKKKNDKLTEFFLHMY